MSSIIFTKMTAVAIQSVSAIVPFAMIFSVVFSIDAKKGAKYGRRFWPG